MSNKWIHYSLFEQFYGYRQNCTDSDKDLFGTVRCTWTPHLPCWIQVHRTITDTPLSQSVHFRSFVSVAFSVNLITLYVVDNSDWTHAYTMCLSVTFLLNYFLFSSTDDYVSERNQKWRKIKYIPGDNGVHSDAPIVSNMVNIGVANTTVQDLDCHIVHPIFSVCHKRRMKH